MPDVTLESLSARLDAHDTTLAKLVQLLPPDAHEAPSTTGEWTDADGNVWRLWNGIKEWLRGPAVAQHATAKPDAVPASWQPGDGLFVPTHNANPTSITRIPVYGSGIVYAMVDDGSGLREVPVQWNAVGVRNLTREAA